MLINIEHIYKYFNGEALLKDICFTLNENETVGIVGRNGCGKSTLLKMILGEEEYDKAPDGNGSLTVKDCVIGFLEQNSGLDSQATVIEEMNDAFAELKKVKARMDELTALMTGYVGDQLEMAADEYSRLSSYFELHDGYNTEFKIKQILNGMGFSDLAYDREISSLSGGEKTRLALAKLLLEQPELLILDEPTNHLDFKTLIWLESYLKTYRGAIVIVSHDRYFLDKLCSRIVEIENGSLTSFKGNYTAYTQLKEQLTARQLKEYNSAQQQIAQLEDYIARNKVRASTAKMAKSREKQLERMDVPDKPLALEKPPKISLGYTIEPTKDVVQVVDCPLVVGEGENEKTLIESLDLHVRRGEHVALIGSNGIGKTSVLKMIQGIIPKRSGNIVWGNNVKVSYFDQEHASLNPHDTAIEAVSRRFPQMTDAEIRKALASVLFHGEDVFKPISVLSGGERAKLCFAIMALNKGNFLILDEPTNHIDLATKEVLEEALKDFTGTMLIVSHDRYLLSKTASRIVELTEGSVRSFDGGFETYIETIEAEERAEQERLAENKRLKAEEDYRQSKQKAYRSKQQRADDAKRRQRIKELETEIAELEEFIETLEEEIASPEVSGDFALMTEKCAQLEQSRLDIEAKMEEWASLE
ncbi:ATP-binding cassette, subfamily F, member 3 [Ruminococcus sp. YE71]|uniref:ABC-F family ATP-binding cassette domain-containing protein n=1 Tax=unclassified Ruminococcus TaxID=2608920 RepID=UPI0008916F61|nr:MULTISPECIES: ABC-F family ATP-binding cassette domain-containing protein [unclassified Ruminococcus]SDA23971.1 ATP-binding cassette, subfamily F, member 3 [Ruminococcus sp. YE78]SFW40795.1 ATP-binding cassette, subfamily F, member 3 [Ruminococcus sp. YE71]